MGKLQDKRIELARRILDTTDEAKLDLVAAALNDPKPYVLPKAEIKAFEDYLERYERGEEKPKDWSSVKRRLSRKVGK